MRSYSFSDEVLATVARERYEYPDPRVQERMEILWLKSKNETNDRIGELANVSRSTVQRTLRLYAKGGLDGLCLRPPLPWWTVCPVVVQVLI